MGEGMQFQLIMSLSLSAATTTTRARARIINPFLKQPPPPNSMNTMMKKKLQSQSQSSKINKRNHHDDLSLITKRVSSNRKKNELGGGGVGGGGGGKRLITISTSDGRWNNNGKWNCDYLVSLQDLCLQDLIEVEFEDHRHRQQVSINLSIEKHASFGLSVDGRIITSFTRKCSNCSSPYCKKIDTNFKVWVLLSSNKEKEHHHRNNNGNSNGNNNIKLPDIGGDPSVMYVKRGSYEANLDSLVQETIRLNTTLEDTCSESCEKSQPTIQYIGAKNTASMDKRWGKLLEIRNSLIQ